MGIPIASDRAIGIPIVILTPPRLAPGSFGPDWAETSAEARWTNFGAFCTENDSLGKLPRLRQKGAN